MDKSESFFTDSRVVMTADFSDYTTLPSQGYSLLVKAKRNGRWWLLKGLKEDFRDQTIYQVLLQKEYDILCLMQHPSIVSVFSLEEVPTLGPCIVMEWVEGITLKQWLNEHHSIKEQRHVATLLMEAVEYIHSLQTEHRDLKPSNIMITNQGQHLKLIDFGLSDTKSYAILKSDAGTEGYMAPDGPSDIYSLGVIFSEMQLGLFSRLAIRHCLAPKSERYSHVKDLQTALHRCWLWPRRIVMGLVLLVVIVLCAVQLRSVLHTQQTHISQVETALSDSLSRVKTASQRKSDSLQQRIVELESTNQVESQQSLQVSAIIKGIQQSIDKEVSLSEMEARLDTAQTQMSIGAWPIRTKEKLFKLVDQQIALKAQSLSPAIQQTIKAQLHDYIKTHYADPWTQRAAALPLY